MFLGSNRLGWRRPRAIKPALCSFLVRLRHEEEILVF